MNSRKSLDNNTEEVSLNKQRAYRVDAFLSATPYAKPLALLVATLLLICLGGLALFGVTNDNLADSLWLSWTYVADSGNHANSDGIGPRLVCVSISFGGMLIFAMMLGLVSDAISEKFDSLRKGKGEVVEQNHTLILGWSDKLVYPYFDGIVSIQEMFPYPLSEMLCSKDVFIFTGIMFNICYVPLLECDAEWQFYRIDGDHC